MQSHIVFVGDDNVVFAVIEYPNLKFTWNFKGLQIAKLTVQQKNNYKAHKDVVRKLN
jgi:hypothetical protein